MAISYVYKGVNETKQEIYCGVSQDPKGRIDGSHCDGYTKAIKHWDCAKDKLKWSLVTRHDDQPAASTQAHALEKVPVAGYKVIQTAGI
jgi:predicted GIY-YIG superfamily endonuclease